MLHVTFSSETEWSPFTIAAWAHWY